MGQLTAVVFPEEYTVQKLISELVNAEVPLHNWKLFVDGKPVNDVLIDSRNKRVLIKSRRLFAAE